MDSAVSRSTVYNPYGNLFDSFATLSVATPPVSSSSIDPRRKREGRRSNRLSFFLSSRRFVTDLLTIRSEKMQTIWFIRVGFTGGLDHVQVYIW